MRRRPDSSLFESFFQIYAYVLTYTLRRVAPSEIFFFVLRDTHVRRVEDVSTQKKPGGIGEGGGGEGVTHLSFFLIPPFPRDVRNYVSPAAGRRADRGSRSRYTPSPRPALISDTRGERGRDER